MGLVWDLADAGGQALMLRLDWGDDVLDPAARRLPQIASGLLGQQSVLEPLVGGLPEGGRAPIRSLVEGLETAYREGVAEPISTALTVGSLAESDTYGERTGITNPFNRQIWRDAYRISQDRSPGQSFGLMFTKDVLDDQEVQRALGSDWFRVVSGTSDALLRVYVSPDVLAGKAATSARLRYVTKPVTSTGYATAAGREVAGPSLLGPTAYRVPIVNPETIEQTRRIQRVVTDMGKLNAAQIADRYFDKHPFRAEIATLLAEAPDDAARMDEMKGLLGSGAAIDRLGRRSAHLANRIRRLEGDQRSLAVISERGSLFDHADEITRLDSELDELYSAQMLAERREAAYGTIRELPRYRRTAAIRDTVTRSETFQTSRYAAPLRVVGDMMSLRPHSLINLEDPTSETQAARLVRKADLPLEQADDLRTRYMRANTADARQVVLVEAEEAVVRHIAARYGIDASAIGRVLDQARSGRGRAATALKARVYDGEGRSLVRLRGESEPVDIPLFVSQQANVLPLVDIDAVEKAAREVAGRWSRYADTAVEIPEDLLSKFYELWKPAVLLRPAWPIRVAIDEQLRIMAKIGFLSTVGQTSRALTGAVRKDVRANKGLTLDGYEFEGAFGRPGEGANLFQQAVSSRASFEALAGRYENGFLEKMRAKLTGEWRSVLPDEPSHGPAWANAVNRQIGSDPVGRLLLQGKADEEIVTWLRGTEDGQRYARRLPTRTKRPELWLPEARGQVDSYLPVSQLRELALQGKATADDLARWIPDARQRPTVHGEILAQTLGSSPINAAYEKVISGMYKALGQLPTDVLARQPYADAVYRAEVERLFRLHQRGGVEITDRRRLTIEAQARRAMVKETRALLYDLAEQSELSHVLRFVAPFFSAWQEVLGVWAGLAVENPAFIARTLKTYGAPEKAGLVTKDDQGNSYVTVKLPEWTRDKVPGFASQGRVRFDLGSLNMVLNGPPGVGPTVQIPASIIVKDRPDWAENDVVSTFIFPYGVPQDTLQALLPPVAKRLASAAREEDDRAFLNASLRIWQTKMIDVSLGKRPEANPEQLLEEAKSEARKFFLVRAFVSYVSPVGVTFDSPYQAYIDAYRRLRETDPKNADERFLEEYGDEFFPLTQAMTKAVEGIPATVEGFKARGRRAELIDRLEDPSLARLVVGAEGAGEFSRAAYEYQLDAGQRQRLTPEEFIQGPGVRLGWIEYRRAMDVIEAEMLARGLPNMQVRGARDLQQAKKAVIENLAAEHPDWYEEFSTTDRLHWARRIKDLRTIASDPGMQARPEIRGLAEYLRLRQVITDELASRKAHTLTATSNVDVRRVWDAAVDQIALANPAFADLRSRWLASDPVWLGKELGAEDAA